MKNQTKIAFSVLILSASFLFYSFIVNKAAFLSVIKTEAGMVSGVKNSTGDVTAYKGIPFAAPPVGNLRWKAPQPIAHWVGVKKCEAFGLPECMDERQNQS